MTFITGNAPPLGAASPRMDALSHWLSHTFGGAAFEIKPASDDASFRRYFRVTLHRPPECMPRSLIAMDAPPEHLDCRPFADIASLLGDAGVRVPRVYASDFEAGFLLLDDFGTKCYLDVLRDDNADALYADAISTLVTMQANASADALGKYDEAFLRREMALFQEWFLIRHLGLEVDEALHQALANAADMLCAACLSQPRVFVHRDYHSRNLMYRPQQSLGVIDFQDAVEGPIAYDLVSLFRDVYVAWPQARIDVWVERYRRAAVARGLLATSTRDDLTRWFDLTGVQRHLKIPGIFSRLYHRDKKPRYLFDIPRALGYLTTVCARYPELATLAGLLEQRELSARTVARNARIADDLARAGA